jgi:hypothetical protein
MFVTMRRSTAALAAACLAAGLLAACSEPTPIAVPDPGASQPPSPPTTSTSPTSPPPSSTTSSPEPPPLGTVPPPWLGTRVLPETPDGYGEIRPTPPALRDRRFTLPDQLPELPGRGFASRVASPPPADVIARSTWRAGCPVGVDDLAWIRLTFWGFDDQRHTGELLANASVADDLVSVLRRLYADRFPIEEMAISTRADQDAPPTGDGNATEVFNCRPTTGGTSFSQHAYGLAIDVDSFQNPYVKGDLVLPELASSYLDRADVRPGMIEPGDDVVQAFAAIGWEWGGDWQSLKDYQHFSQNGT